MSQRQEIKQKIEKRIHEIELTVARYISQEQIKSIKDDAKATFLNLQSLYDFETSIKKPTLIELEEPARDEKYDLFD